MPAVKQGMRARQLKVRANNSKIKEPGVFSEGWRDNGPRCLLLYGPLVQGYKMSVRFVHV